MFLNHAQEKKCFAMTLFVMLQCGKVSILTFPINLFLMQREEFWHTAWANKCLFGSNKMNAYITVEPFPRYYKR